MHEGLSMQSNGACGAGYPGRATAAAAAAMPAVAACGRAPASGALSKAPAAAAKPSDGVAVDEADGCDPSTFSPALAAFGTLVKNGEALSDALALMLALAVAAADRDGVTVPGGDVDGVAAAVPLAVAVAVTERDRDVEAVLDGVPESATEMYGEAVRDGVGADEGSTSTAAAATSALRGLLGALLLLFAAAVALHAKLKL